MEEPRNVKRPGKPKKVKIIESTYLNDYQQKPLTPDKKVEKPEEDVIEVVDEVKLEKLYELAQNLSQEIQLKSLKINLDVLRQLDRATNPMIKIEGLSRMGLLHNQLFRGNSALLTPIEQKAFELKAKIFNLAGQIKNGLEEDKMTSNTKMVQFYFPDNNRNENIVSEK